MHELDGDAVHNIHCLDFALGTGEWTGVIRPRLDVPSTERESADPSRR